MILLSDYGVWLLHLPSFGYSTYPHLVTELTIIWLQYLPPAGYSTYSWLQYLPNICFQNSLPETGKGWEQEATGSKLA
ncbi:hypothetical protein EB796_000328 [Bugula neritina]|uniref:Uncharacterized protein n=1 Tax=Bugula neritina TaxID=10212 RepID=A0A7J7KT66_BUGNE|nr:hypothetical protein EB796_000328 [Bugula neritina]